MGIVRYRRNSQCWPDITTRLYPTGVLSVTGFAPEVCKMKPPICTVCKVPFERTYTTTQKTCSPYCAIQDATTKREKKEHREREKQLKSDRRELRARKVAIKPL